MKVHQKGVVPVAMLKKKILYKHNFFLPTLKQLWKFSFMGINLDLQKARRDWHL